MQLQSSTIQPRKGHQTDKYKGPLHTISKLRHGHGVYTYDPFFTYQGNYEQGKKNGEGVLRLKDGRIIKAVFINDQIIGPAQIDYPDGSKYTGNLHFGEREGEGSFESLFESYKGFWKNNCKHGRGVYQNHSNSEYYEGQYTDDKPHGAGHLVRWNYQYQGSFEKGLREGSGREINDWSSQGPEKPLGRYEYNGYFKSDLFGGEGEFKSRQSKYIYRGQFALGLPILYPNQFRCYLSVNTKSGQDVVEGEKSLLQLQPIEYQLEGDSFNLYIETVYQGPQMLDEVQPTQEDIDNMIKNWQNENKKNKNPPPMPDFSQPKMKKPDMVVVAQETGRPVQIRLLKQAEGKEEALKIDYRSEMSVRRKENQQARLEALKKAEEEGNKKGGKKDNKVEQLKVNLFKQNASQREKVLSISSVEGKCSISRLQFPDDFPQGKYTLEIASSFTDFGAIKPYRKEVNIKSKVVKKK